MRMQCNEAVAASAAGIFGHAVEFNSNVKSGLRGII